MAFTNGQAQPEAAQYVVQQPYDQEEEQYVPHSGYFNPADELEHRNARTYYLDPERLLRDLRKYLTGRKTSTSPRAEDHALVPDIVADQIINQLRVPMDKVSLLSNLKPQEINERVYRIREGIAGWLTIEGYRQHNLNVNHFEIIMNQIETLLLSAFKWSQNAGGRYFLTTSNRSVESQTHVMNNGERVQRNSGGRMFNPFKPM